MRNIATIREDLVKNGFRVHEVTCTLRFLLDDYAKTSAKLNNEAQVAILEENTYIDEYELLIQVIAMAMRDEF